MVEVVELAERREPALEHLHHRVGRDGFHVVGREDAQEPVHDLPPGPEGIALRPAGLGEAGHPALERVAVHVRQSRQRDAGDALPATPVRPRLHGEDRAVLDVERHVLRPALRQESVIEDELAHG